MTFNPTILTSIGDLTIQQLQTGSAGTAVATGTVSSAGTGTLNQPTGKVTTVSLTTAAAGVATLAINDSLVSAGDIVIASVGNGSNTTGTPVVTSATATAGKITVVIQNIHVSAAFNGTLIVSYLWIKPGS